MKKFRKLVPALCMLLISAVLLGTSTFAWFSMNTTVTATGMQVTAKTDHTYLLITDNSENKGLDKLLQDLQANPTAANRKVDFAMGTASSLAPSAHETFGATGASTDAATVGKWYSAQGKTPDKTDMKDDTKTALTGFDGYVLTKSVYITVTKDSKAAANLKVSATITKNTTATDITPIKVLVVCGDKYVELSFTTSTSETVLAETISAGELTEVDIYIYYDGAHANVTTNNSANLGGAAVELTFAVDN